MTIGYCTGELFQAIEEEVELKPRYFDYDFDLYGEWHYIFWRIADMQFSRVTIYM